METWTEDEISSSNLNNKALNSIVGSLHESVFTLVTGIKEAKHYGKSLKQDLRNLMNRASVLGEPFTDERVVKKILRSLPKRFRMKVTAIQENAGWEKKSVGELMGNLHTYELQVLADDDPAVSREGKSMAFLAEADRESDTDDIDDEALALLTKNFKKILKGFNRRSQRQSNRTQYKSGNSSYQKLELSTFTKNSQTQTRRTGQFRTTSNDTAKTLNRDDEEEATDDPSDENVGNFVAFFTATEGHSEEDENDACWEQLVKINKNLNDDLKHRDDRLKELNTELVAKEDLITQIRSREGKLIKELEDLKKTIRMMDTTSTLDRILDSGRNPNDKKGLGFEQGQSSMSAPTFVKEGTVEQGQSSRSTQFYQKGNRFTSITESEPGKVKFQSQHSRDQRKEKYQNKSITPFTKQVWVKKSEVICYPTIVLTASMTEVRWYFDSGCSRHMTGNAKCLIAVQPNSGSMTYGDGQKGKIVGKCKLNVPGLPHLDDVLLVSGLKANLISISQLCDQNWDVCFNRDCCRVRNKSVQVVMEGTRSSDNCYVLTSEATCLMSKAEESKLWHRRLGHINFRDMDKVVKLDAV
ncbi:PREDICTED: uncharacterized protein LOC109179776 [Ipomoea nil]|uniref:uncharacterized protein LOC109179776 n=1 Tax=Ipomoea nil TaxID=35883 RepID=UPI000901181B|nr:PREDICTED: uncharacterized protein LOC109179776 [Ipomoea nil]